MSLANNIVIADDHPIFRKGLIDLLQEIPELNQFTFHEAEDGLQAYHKILAHRPVLAILDHEMPHLKGLDVVKKLATEKSNTKLIVLTMYRDKNYFLEAQQHGVMGYLLKENAGEELKLCVQEALKGNTYFTDEVLGKLQENPQSESNESFNQLTATEKIILKLISENKTSQQIADLLFVSANTIEVHRAKMVKKLGLTGKNALLHYVNNHIKK